MRVNIFKVGIMREAVCEERRANDIQPGLVITTAS